MTRRKRPKLNGYGYRKVDSFIKLDHGLLKTEAWRCLSPDGKAVLLDMWARHNGLNNGAIGYSQRDGLALLSEAWGRRVSKRRVKAAFDDIQDKGFAVVARESSFTTKTREAREWEITAEKRGDNAPRRLFKTWSAPPEKKITGTATVPDRNRYGTCGRRKPPPE